MYKSGLTVVAHVADSPKQQEIVTFIPAILLNVVEPLWVFTVQMCNINYNAPIFFTRGSCETFSWNNKIENKNL